jgi:hypothetical protein
MVIDFTNAVIKYHREQLHYNTKNQKTSPMLKKKPCEPLIPNP